MSGFSSLLRIAMDLDLYAADHFIQIRSGEWIVLQLSMRHLHDLFKQASRCRQRHPLYCKPNTARTHPQCWRQRGQKAQPIEAGCRMAQDFKAEGGSHFQDQIPGTILANQ